MLEKFFNSRFFYLCDGVLSLVVFILLMISLPFILGLILPNTFVTFIVYVMLAACVWVTTNFTWAMGMMGYQFEKWYHWSSVGMGLIAIVQPILYILFGIYIF